MGSLYVFALFQSGIERILHVFTYVALEVVWDASRDLDKLHCPYCRSSWR